MVKSVMIAVHTAHSTKLGYSLCGINIEKPRSPYPREQVKVILCRRCLSRLQIRMPPDPKLNYKVWKHAETRAFLLHVLRETKGNRNEAARQTGVSRATFYRMLASHDIEVSWDIY